MPIAQNQKYTVMKFIFFIKVYLIFKIYFTYLLKAEFHNSLSRYDACVVTTIGCNQV